MLPGPKLRRPLLVIQRQPGLGEGHLDQNAADGNTYVADATVTTHICITPSQLV